MSNLDTYAESLELEIIDLREQLERMEKALERSCISNEWCLEGAECGNFDCCYLCRKSCILRMIDKEKANES